MWGGKEHSRSLWYSILRSQSKTSSNRHDLQHRIADKQEKLGPTLKFSAETDDSADADSTVKTDEKQPKNNIKP